jgi:hypothetical protein
MLEVSVDQFNKYLETTFQSERSVVFRLAIFAGLLLFYASVAHSQTVDDVAKLPEAQQREIIMRFVNNSIANLPSHTDRNGMPKSAEDYARDRTLANLVRALFIQDPKYPQDVPEGLRVMLIRIKKYSTETPNRTVLDVMSELVGWSFQHFYTDHYTPEEKAKDANKSDAEQEAYFRLNIEMYENEGLYQQTMKELKDKDAKMLKEIEVMEENTVILPDGRSVFKDKNGDLWTYSGSGSTGIKLEGRDKALAERLGDCKAAHHIATGKEALAVCRAELGLDAAPAPVPAVDNRSMTPDDDPIGGGGFITPYQPPR